MVCNNCGFQSPDDATFCGNCGAPLTNIQAPIQAPIQNVPKQKNKSSKVIIAIVVVTLVIILALVAVMIISFSAKKSSQTTNITVSEEATTAANVLSISLVEHEKTLGVGDSDTLAVSCNPADTAVIWSSSDTTIVKVENGIITGISAGSAKITVSAGGLTDTCVITVKGAAPVTVVVQTTKSVTFTPDYSGGYWLHTTSIKNDLGGESYLYGMSYNDVQYMIDEILARHGYIFKQDNERTRYFKAQPWYTPVYSSMSYVESTFNKTERENYQFLANYRNKYLQ